MSKNIYSYPLRLTYFVLIIIILGCEKKEEKIKPIYRPMTESVYASIIIQPKDLYHVYPSVNGVIENLFIEENQVLKKGAPIAQIRNSAPQVNIEKAKLNTDLATQNFDRQTDILRSIQNEINAAQIKLQTDSIQFSRQKRLWDQNIGSEMQFENKKLAYELSANTLLSLKDKYQQTKIEMDNQLTTQIKLAKNSLKSTQVVNNDFLIKSNIAGKVYSVFKNTGESVLVQEPIATIGAENQFIIEMEVDEVDIARLKLGQKVLLSLDAYKNKIFEATISKIYPQKQVRTQTFKVEGIFKNVPETLYAGLSGEANIVISKKEKTITIPLDFLVENGKVKTKEGLITIETGVSDMQYIEVISGIDTSTNLIKPK